MDFGKRLQKLRNHFGYLQKDLGEKLNRTASAYGKMERSAKPPSAHHIDQLAAIYGLSPEELNSDCELEFYTDAAGKPMVKARKKNAFSIIELVRSLASLVLEVTELRRKGKEPEKT